MKILTRSAALALAVLSLGAVVSRPVSVSAKATMAKSAIAIPVPTCPTNDPNGCGIYQN